MDRIFCLCGPFFALFLGNPKKQNFEKMKKKKPLEIYITISHMRTTRQSYDVCSWDMERDRHNFLTFWSIFCPYPSNNPENQNFEKMKEKKSGDIFLLHVCTINESHSVWFLMECNRHNYSSFWAIYCLFTPILLPSYYICATKIMIKW